MSSLYCYLFYFSLARVVLHYGRVQMNGPNKTAMSPVHTDHSDRSRAWELVSSFVTSFEMSFTSSHSSFFWFSFSANAFAIGSKRTLKISRSGGWDSKCTLTQSWGSKVCVCWGGVSLGGWGMGRLLWADFVPQRPLEAHQCITASCVIPTIPSSPLDIPISFLQQFWTAGIQTPGPADLDLLPTSQSFLFFSFFSSWGKYWLSIDSHASHPVHSPVQLLENTNSNRLRFVFSYLKTLSLNLWGWWGLITPFCDPLPLPTPHSGPPLPAPVFLNVFAV